MRADSISQSGDGLGVARGSARSPFSLLTRAIDLTGRMVGGTMGAIAREFRASSTFTSGLETPTDQLMGVFGATTKSGATVSEETCFAVPTLAACINILAQSIAMLPIRIYRETSAGSEEVTDHPARQLLRRKPGPGQTSYQWRAWKMLCACLGGNGYSRIFRNGYFEPTAIVPMKVQDTEPRLLSDGRLIYRYQGQILQDYEVLHFRGLSSNGFTGRSPLHDLRDSVGLSMVAQDFASSTFRNGNRQPGVITLPPTTDKAKADEFKKFYQENYSGALNAGKAPIFMGGAQWANAGFSNQDAELLMSRKFSVEEIARFYRVPLTLLQSMEKSTSFGTGIAELSRGFVNFTLTPWVRNFEEEMEDKLLSEVEKAKDFSIRFDFSMLLRGSPQEQATYWATLIQNAMATPNQGRRGLHMPELPDGPANELYTALLQPAGVAGAKPGAVADPTKADPGDPE